MESSCWWHSPSPSTTAKVFCFQSPKYFHHLLCNCAPLSDKSFALFLTLLLDHLLCSVCLSKTLVLSSCDPPWALALRPLS